FLRYADFNCIEDGKIVRSSFFCDLIGFMHQLGINPLPPQTGASFIYPGPRTHDGLLFEPQDHRESQKTLELVNRMIGDLTDLNTSENDCPPPDLLTKTWHDDMIWYGPAGIGASYTIPRYQEQHQYPFRRGLKDKVFNGHICRFAEGNYAGSFGWPNLTNTATGGFLGLPASGVAADMRVVDIYRRQGNKLAENWVFIDFPWWLKQQGLNIIERIKNVIP
nr:ester cyclase [Candidatus Neomarinimicrobiota bacterium]